MFLVPIKSPGITMRRIKQVDGGNEFCEEFFDGLELGDDAVVGEVNGGWAVASRQLYHERRAVGGGSEFASGIGAEGETDKAIDYSPCWRRPVRPTTSGSRRWPDARWCAAPSRSS